MYVGEEFAQCFCLLLVVSCEWYVGAFGVVVCFVLFCFIVVYELDLRVVANGVGYVEGWFYRGVGF